MNRSLEDVVRSRAAGRCEYCRIPQQHHAHRLQIEHIISRQHGGPTESHNLALSCTHCNLHKGPNIAGIDPETGDLVPLFNPRTDVWSDHFEWNGPELVARTPVGRVTIRVLAMNSPLRVQVRAQLMGMGLYEA